MKLAWRMLQRDWRAGELRLLALALAIAVASVTSVGFFADRVRQGLVRDAHQLLGGDLVLGGDQPLGPELTREAQSRGLAVATATNFISMARSGDAAQLSAVKAVAGGYPLRGRVKTTSAIGVPDAVAIGLPATGTVWVDELLVNALKVKVGDSIELGDSRFTIAAIITIEPDRGVSFFNLAPRVLMNESDLAATKLIQVGSRVTYRLYVAGEAKTVEGFRGWLGARLDRGQQIQDLENARPEIRQGLDRAQQFLGLTALLAVILAAVAIALATRRYVRRHLDGYAVMRCMGASQGKLMALFGWEFLYLGLIGAIAGALLGLVVQGAIGWALAGLVDAALPAPGLAPALQGVATGLVLLAGFAFPPLAQLANVPALRVLRRDVGNPRAASVSGYVAGFITLGALLIWQAGDLKLGLYVFGGFAGALAVFALVGYLVVRASKFTSGWGGLSWRYGVASLRRRAGANTVQIMALGIALTAILLLLFTRADLVDAWRSKTPVNAPNRFVLNIQPEQQMPVAEFFKSNALPEAAIYPMVRGRLVQVNDRPVSGDGYSEARAKRLVEREFNLSFMANLPKHDEVVAGRWSGDADDGLSLEVGIAKTLGVELGDRLTFSVGGQSFTGPITSLRKLDWDSMQVNFFVIVPPAVLRDFPTSYITAFHLNPAQASVMPALSQQFPNLTVVDLSAILAQALSVMEKVIGAVQIVFFFALAAGILVLFAALAASHDERMHEAALMRALGASRAQVAAAHRVEFLAIGITAGILAAFAATAIGTVLATKVFQFPYTINPWVFAIGPLLALACVGFNAWQGTRAAVRQPPMAALRSL